MTRTRPISRLLYRSLAVRPMEVDELRALLVQAQARNRRERLTGFLVYDRQRFVQWLEGPEAALARVWSSIRRDPRHHAIERLPVPRLDGRLFSAWTMQIGLADPPGFPAVRLPAGTLRDLRERRVPEHGTLHGIAFRHGLPPAADIAQVLARGSGDAFARLQQEVTRWQPTLHEIAEHFFHPVMQALGDAWHSDRLLGADLAVAEVRLATLLHTVARRLRWDAEVPLRGRALVAQVPGEIANAGVALACISLAAAGFAVDCEFPHSAEALYARLAQTRYDLLHLQASSQIARATLLPALPPLIRRARGASANAQVVVLVAGRLFDQRPGLSALVGADADALEHGATPREIDHVLALKASRRGTAPLRFAEAVIAEVGQAMLERPDPADAPQVPRAHRPNGAASAGKPHARRGTA